VDTGVKKEYLRREYEKAASGEYTADCREHCTACGLGCEPPKPLEAPPEPPVLRPLRPEAKSKKPIRVRARFSKTGALRHLSHRELITHITRAIRRAGVDVDYSKGFNPAPRIAFGPPLGVGVAGLREYFDMEVFPGTPLRAMGERLNAALAEDVRIDGVAPVGMKEPSLQEFVARYAYEVGSCPDTGAVEEFMKRGQALVERKKGLVDIRPMVEEAEVLGPGRVGLLLKDHKDKKVRLDEIVKAVFGRPAADLDITRTGVFGYRGRWVEPLEGEGRSWQAASS
jgi:radical SAM-linked protein